MSETALHCQVARYRRQKNELEKKRESLLAENVVLKVALAVILVAAVASIVVVLKVALAVILVAAVASIVGSVFHLSAISYWELALALPLMWIIFCLGASVYLVAATGLTD